MAYTQDGRLISVETPLGKDVLLLQSFTGTEGLSKLFHYKLQLLSEKADISPDKIVGQRVTISVLLKDETKKRYINGFVSSFTQGSQDNRFTSYEAEVVPWPWFLTRYANCRIFQKKKIPDIIQEIFKDQPHADVKPSLQGNYDEREYCVQYRETDFNFVSRLMEQYGIYYYFEHTKDKHTLVLGDTPSGHQPCPEQKKASYDSTTTAMERDDVVTGWSQTQELRSGKFALTDYNFETPSTDLKVNVPSTVKVGGNDSFEVFDYPGDYEKKDQGNHLVKLRVEEEEATHLLGEGSSGVRTFASGYRFELVDHYCKSFNAEYVLTEIHHDASVGTVYQTGQAEGESYFNCFSCIPKSFPFRPPRLTPRPVVQGPQTAVVVGPDGEEIYTDKYGRVKVQFFWDRVGEKNEKSSCWIRVSQPWAGKNWGAIWNPRMGQEVIVDFLEGDPDRPIITGRVYNAEQTVPYKLPDKQTVSTFKSRSSKNGGDSNYNELRFEDNKGSEQVFLHAERDLDVGVEAESREDIGKNFHLNVGGSQYEKVGKDLHQDITENHVEKVGTNLHVQVGANHEEKVSVKYALDAGTEVHIKSGVTLVIEAGTGITLKVGGNYVTLSPAGVAIQGTMVLINSGGMALSGTGASPGSPKAPDKADPAEKFDKG
jgi:type VI secretion system secreted protein VgrG